MSVLTFPQKEVHPNLTELVQVFNNSHIYDLSELSPLIQKQCISTLRRYYKSQRVMDVHQVWHRPVDYLTSWALDNAHTPMARPYKDSPHYFHSSTNGVLYTSKALAHLPSNQPLLTFNYFGFLTPYSADKYFTTAVKLSLTQHLKDWTHRP